MLELTCLSLDGASVQRRVTIQRVIVAGWTARDAAAQQAHIEELAELGVQPPAATPMFYRVAATLATTAGDIQVSGESSSGEVEPVAVMLDDGLWVGVGSDHTDRKAEAAGITLAKQLCAKPVAPTLWRFGDVAGHWDQLQLRCHAVVGGSRRLYQEGAVAALLRPEQLIERWTDDGRLRSGDLMFLGTLPVIGGIQPAERFELTLHDPHIGRSIEHAYQIEALPVVG